MASRAASAPPPPHPAAVYAVFIKSACLYIREPGGRPLRDARPSAARLACVVLGLALDLVGRGDMTRPIRWAGGRRRAGRPCDVSRIFPSRSGDPSTRTRSTTILSVLGRQSTVLPPVDRGPSLVHRPLHRRPSRAIGLTGPRDLYRTAHSPVRTGYSRCSDFMAPSSDLWITMTWHS